MDIASLPCLNPVMRSGLFTPCVLLALPAVLFAQGATPPTIVAEPASVSVYVGEPLTLSAGVDGTAPLSLQWYRNAVPVAGATSLALTRTAAAAADAGVYHLVATNAHGTAQTRPVGVFVEKRPQAIAFSPPVTTAVAGSGLVLNATASSGLAVTYALVSGVGTLNGGTLSSPGGAITVRATQAGDGTYAAAAPVEITFHFVAGGVTPFVTTAPLDQTVDAGGSVTFRAAAIGTPAPTLRWSKEGATLPETTGATLRLSDVSLLDAGRYTVTASNALGSHSATATLVVRAAPVIISGPSDQSAFAGDRVTLSATVTGVPLPTFQWRRNGSVIAGATAATLTLAAAVTGDAGTYTVTAANALGSATSQPAVLTVAPRDFAGVYFGRFTGTEGDFALAVRPDRSAVLLAVLPSRQTGLAITNLRVEPGGAFTLATATLAGTRVTLRGTLDDAAGTVAGTLTELGAAFGGTRAAATGTPAGQAGIYALALIGSATGRGQAIVAPDGRAFLLTATGTAPEAAIGTVEGTGRLEATTPSLAVLSLTFGDGLVTGSVRTPAGARTCRSAPPPGPEPPR